MAKGYRQPSPPLSHFPVLKPTNLTFSTCHPYNTIRTRLLPTPISSPIQATPNLQTPNPKSPTLGGGGG